MQQPLPNDLAGLTPEQVRAAATKAETPASVPTVEFKELGDTRRNAVMDRLIRTT